MADAPVAASSPANPTEYLASLSNEQYQDWKAGKLPEPQQAEDKPKTDGAAPSKEVTPKEDSTPSQDQSRLGAESVDGEKTPAKTAAEPEAAKDQEPKKGKRDAQARILQLLAENKKLKADLAVGPRVQAEEKKEPVKAAEQKTEAKPAAAKETRPKPKQTDTNPDGTDKYASFADFTEDLADWKAEQRVEAFKAEQQTAKDTEAKAAKEAETKQQQTEAQKAWSKRIEDAEKKHSDFKEVALNPDLPIPEGSVVLNFVDHSPSGMDVLYYMGENPDELIRINALKPYEQLEELYGIVAELKAAESTKEDAPDKEKPTVPVIKTTRTAKPPTEASGRTSAPDDAAEAALRNRDPGAYMREMNRREHAARQKKA